MVTFILWIAVIGAIVCVLVYASLIAVICVDVWDWHRKQGVREVLPPPDRAAERMYGIQYFIRAIGRK